MESGGSGEYDEVHDEIGKEGTSAHIEFAIDELPRSRASSLHDYSAAHCFLGFYFLGGLPEKQVRAYGCAEDSDEVLPGSVIFRPSRDECIAHDRGPMGLHHEGRNDVSEQTKRQPFQNRCDLIITAAHGPECDRDAE